MQGSSYEVRYNYIPLPQHNAKYFRAFNTFLINGANPGLDLRRLSAEPGLDGGQPDFKGGEANYGTKI